MNARRFCLVVSVLFALLVLPAFSAAAQPGDSFSVTFSTPPHTINLNGEGYDAFEMEEYGNYSAPGDPMLPGRVFDVALPPDVVPASVAVTVTAADFVELPETYNIAPAPPPETWIDGKKVVDWGPNADAIVDGKNTAVYDADAFYPADWARLSTLSQMRKWKFVRVLVSPVRWNPVSGKAQVAGTVTVQVSFERSRYRTQADAPALRDRVMDDRAAEMFVNFAQAQPWYEPPLESGAAPAAAPATTYAIITTKQIVWNSQKLDDFVAHKQSLGYNVVVVHQDHYGALTGQAPNGRAEKIRQWLKNNYIPLNIEYVLLIGNPDPDEPLAQDYVGDLPMKMVYPSDTANDLVFTVPTDYFYADLTGNWDLNGDLLFGDVPDREPGGVDLTAEVFAGRIPVYTSDANWISTLDSILQKTIDYERATDIAWRKQVLLPMAFMDAYRDEAPMAELMIGNYLRRLGFSAYTMYEQGDRGPAYDSVYDSDAPLVWPAVRTRWQEHPYGLVVWSTHGWAQGAVLVLNDWETAYLNDNQPALTFQLSCLNGFPEAPDNLGYSLLRKGAIGTVSASRVSWGFYSPPNPVGGSNTDHAYFYTERLAQNWPAGEALYTTKAQFTDFWWLANRTAYNLYGDPAISLGVGGKQIYVSSNGGGAVAGIAFQNKDILVYDTTSETWAMYFDGSDVGIKSNVDAFDVKSDGSIVMSLSAAQTLAPLGTVKPQDLIRFMPTTIGDNTSGAFTMYLRGAPNLTTSGENVDAYASAPGYGLISTVGGAAVTGPVKAADEDLLGFGDYDWVRWFDGSVCLPPLAATDVWGAWYDRQNGDLYLSAQASFSPSAGRTITNRQIFKIPGGQCGAAPVVYWDAAAAGFNYVLDDFSIER